MNGSGLGSDLLQEGCLLEQAVLSSLSQDALQQETLFPVNTCHTCTTKLQGN